MAKITVDIEAQVKGYEKSLKVFETELTKLNPGAEISKNISKALEKAKTEVKNLSKNMQPTASSDADIARIVNKVNSAGVAVQQIAKMFQELDTTDLNLGRMGKEVTDLTSQIGLLEEELQSKLSQSFREFINSSESLKSLFQDLGIDTAKASIEEFFAGLEKGSSTAKKVLGETEKALKKAYNAVNENQEKQLAQSARALGTTEKKDVIVAEVEEIASLYEQALQPLQTTVSKGLTELLTGNKKLDKQEIIDSFFGGLTPENLSEHISQLREKLVSGGVKLNAEEIYTKLFGESNSGSRSNIVAKKLVEGLNFESVSEEYRMRLQEIYARISSDLSADDKKTILTFLSEADIKKALNATLSSIEKAYDEIQKRITNLKEAQIGVLTPQLNVATNNREQASEQVSSLDQVKTTLLAEIAKLTERNAQLQQQIESLETQLNAKIDAALGTTKASTGAAGNTAAEFQISTEAARAYEQQLAQVTSAEQMVGKIKGVVERWFSVYAVVRMVGNAIRSITTNIQELDKTITEISIVTDMSHSDLWGQMDKYISLADKYASSISGVYQVSQLYYQQGLQSNDVMALTEQTLKMARISGLDYATATDYMTNAIRSFKMEMTDAQTVVDVYSAVAASSATSVSELANAMSKTASSAQAVGSSFQNTTAMMAVMIEATRESAENIGSALKSIISRYGEMKANPSKLIDSEGEAMSLNKVDTALQSVGISIHDAQGQFRDFDDVIMELAEKWDTIDTNTQRYIATIMAGNRQQSRFLALVSSYDRLKELSAEAAESEDASQLQYLKSLDSVDAKLQRVQNSLQSLYINTGIEEAYKWVIDYGKSIVDTFSQMPRLFNLPLPALLKLGTSFTQLAMLVTNLFKLIKTSIQNSINELTVVQKIANEEQLADTEKLLANDLAKRKKYGIQRVQQAQQIRNQERAIENGQGDQYSLSGGKFKNLIRSNRNGIGMGLSFASLALSSVSAGMDVNSQRGLKGGLSIASTALSVVSSLMMLPGPLGKILAIIQGISGVVEAMGIFFESDAEKLDRLSNAAQEASNDYIKKKDATKTLSSEIEELKKLEKQSHLSAEAKKEYQEASDKFAEAHPELISGYDDENHAIIDLTAAYKALAAAATEAAEAGKKAATSGIEYAQEQYNQAEENYTQKVRPKNIAKNANISTDAEVLNWFTDYKYGVGSSNSVLEQYPDRYNQIAALRFGREEATGEEFYYGTLFNAVRSVISEEPLEDEIANAIVDNYENIIAVMKAELDRAQSSFDYPAAMEFTEVIKAVDSIYKNYTGEADFATEQSHLNLTQNIHGEFVKRIADQISTTEANAGEKDTLFDLYSSAESLLKNYLIADFSDWIKHIPEDLQEQLEGKTEQEKYEYYMENNFKENYDNFYGALFKWVNENGTIKENELTQLLSNAKLYDRGSLEIALENLGLGDLVSQILSIYFKEGTFDSNELQTWLKGTNYKFNPEDISGFGETQSRAIQSAAADFKDLESKGQIADAQTTFDKYLEIWQLLRNAPLSAQQAFANWTDYSYFGLLNLSDTLTNLGADVNFDKLQELARLLPANITTAVNSLLTSIQEQAADFASDVSKAKSGMNFKEAAEFIQQYGLELSQLQLSNGKYYYNGNLQDILNKATENFDKTKEKIDQQIEFYAALNNSFFEASNGSAVSTKEIIQSSDFQNADNKFEYLQKKYNVDNKTATSIVNAYNEFYTAYNKLSPEEQAETSFIDFVIKKLEQDKDNVDVALGYLEAQTKAEQIKAGQFKDALGQEIDWNAVRSGDLTGIDEQYYSAVLSHINDIGQFYSDIIDTFGADKAGKVFKVSDVNEELIKELGFEVKDVDGVKQAYIDWEKAQWGNLGITNPNDIKELLNLIDRSDATQEQKTENKTKLLAAWFKNNPYDALSNIINNYDNLSVEQADALKTLSGFDASQISLDEVTGNYKVSLEYLSQYVDSLEGLSVEQANNLKASLEKEISEKSASNIITDVVKNYSSLGIDSLTQLATLLDKGIDELKQSFVIDNGDGSYKLDVAQLNTLMNTDGITDAAKAYLKELIAGISDDFLENINNAFKYNVSGTTKQEDMQKFINDYNTKTQSNLTVADAFTWDSTLETFILNSNLLANYLLTYRKSLIEDLSMSEDEANNYITSQAKSNVKISDYISSSQTTKDRAQLKNQLQSYYTANLMDQFASEDYQDYLTKAKEYFLDSESEPSQQEIENQAKILAKHAAEQNKELVNNAAEIAIGNLDSGGQEAVDLIKQLDENATPEQIEAAYKNNITPMLNLVDGLSNLGVGSFVDPKWIELLQKENAFEIDGNGMITSINDVAKAYQNALDSIAAAGNASVHDINNAVIQAFNAKYAVKQNAAELLSGSTMSFEQLVKAYELQGKTFGKEIKEGEETIGWDYTTDLEALKSEGLIDINSLGQIAIKNFSGMAQKLGWEAGSAEYKAAYSAFIDSQISENEKLDPAKRAASQISNLISGEVGTTVNTHDILTEYPELAKVMGITDDTYNILSEYQRDNMLLAIDTMTIQNTQLQKIIRDAQSEIKSNRSKGNALSDIISSTVSRDTAKTFLNSQGIETSILPEKEINRLMSNRGYIWDEYTQSFYATEDALTEINNRIAEAVAGSTTDQSVIDQWKLQAKQLERTLTENKANKALINLLNSYTNISEDTLDEFKVQFEEAAGIDIEKYITRYDNGTIELTKFDQLMAELGPEYSAIFEEYIATIADTYINNAQKAGSLITEGTTSQVDIEAFQKAYSQVMGDSASIEFYYDSVLKAWTFDSSKLYGFIEKQADQLKLAGEERKQWIQDQIDSITVDNLDFSNILSGTASAKEQAILQKNLIDYYKNHANDYNEDEWENIEEYAKTQAQSTLLLLSIGGQTAINELKSIKSDLSTDEIEAAYRAQIAPIKAVYDSLADLQEGSIVAKNQIDILNTAGFTVSADGVVEVVGDLASAYKSIYEQMRSTGEATVQELNQAFGSYLDNREGRDKQQQSIDALGKAASMTYSEFAEIFTNAGVELTQELFNTFDSLNIIKDLGGNKMQIANFTLLAQHMGWKADSEEYISAFKAYNDSLIEYNNRIKTDLENEFNSVAQAKPGDQINLTRFTTEMTEPVLKQKLSQFGAVLQNGILTITENTDIGEVANILGQFAIEQGAGVSNEILATIDQLRNKKNIDLTSAYKSVVSNVNNLSVDIIKDFAEATNQNYNDLISYLTSNSDGTYKMDYSLLRSMVETGRETLGETTYQELMNNIANLQNDILSQISSSMSYVYQGTNNVSDMQNFTNKFNQLTGQQLNVSDLFEYDTLLDNFVLNSDKMQEYINQQKIELEKLGMSGDAINEYIKDQTIGLLQQNLNIDGFIEATGTTEKSKAGTLLRQQIIDYVKTKGTQLTERGIESYADSIIERLDAGGVAAVNALKQIKGETVTTDELSKVYNASIDRLRTAAEDLTKGVGETVSGSVIGIMEAAGFGLASLDDGSAVITSVGNMVAAYMALYAAMSSNAQATTQDLNSTYASLLTAADKSRTDALDTLENASGMAYDSFGELLTQYGISFEEVMTDSDKWGVKSDGFGKIVITNFNDFVAQMNEKGANWDINSPAYAEAYASYVDSQAELANKPAQLMQNAADQLKTLAEAKPGEAVNVSYLHKSLGDNLETIVKNYGGELKDGLLTLTNVTDIPGLVTDIGNAAAKAGALIPEQLAELADTVAQMLSEIANLIKSGITGSLNNVDAQKLTTWAKNNGFKGKLDFIKTAEGLQLSTESAIQLYDRLKQIDSIQAQLVFEELSKSLQENNDNFRTTSALIAHVKNISSGVYAADSQVSGARLKQYQAELAVAQEILAVRATQEDSTWNFMSNKIPAAQNNPLNFAKNLTQAFTAFRDAFDTSKVQKNGKAGFMDYEDWYNIVTQFNSMATKDAPIILSDAIKLDGTLSAAANAIQAGAEHLTAVDTGELKVNLTDISIGIQSGSAALTSGVEDAIHSIAQAQVDALDGLIAMLELIVAMESLGDIDVDSNGINLKDIFKIDYGDGGQEEITGFQDAYITWREKIINQITQYNDDGSVNEAFNQKLADAMSSIKINGTSLAQMISWEVSDWQTAGTMIAQGYSDTMAALYKAALSNNYDLDNITESVKQVLIESGVNNLTIDVGDTTLVLTSTGVTQIDWSTDNSKKIIEAVKAKFGEDSDTHTIITDAIAKFKNGDQMESYEVEWVLRMDGRIKIVNGENTVYWNNKPYGKGDPGYQAAIAAWRLKDAGVDVDNIKPEEIEGGTITTTTTIGNKTNIKVESDGTTITYYSEGGREYHSPTELLQGEYKKYLEVNEFKRNIMGLEDTQDLSYEQWAFVEYGIRVKTTTKITDANGKPIDLTTDKSTRKKIDDFINQSKDDIQEAINKGADGQGNYNVDIGGGIIVTFSGDDITVDGTNVDADLVKQKLNALLGIDNGLADTIKVGITTAFTEMPDLTFDADTSAALQKLNELKEEAKNISSDLKVGNNEVGTQITSNVNKASTNPAKQSIMVSSNSVWAAIDSNVVHGANNPVKQKIEDSQATGNVSAKGNAFATGTLMGELGPELVVSNGRYFIAGQNGPEMVNLADDAIVFNHLQTKSLLEKGMSSGRGRAVTNERKAISYAKGNVNGGPAMASAASALAALRQLRGEWASLLSLSAKDLAGKGGGGGGGGGDKAFIKDLERWYNWLQKIAQLEKEITHQETLRSKLSSDMVPNGRAYYNSLKDQTKKLGEQIQLNTSLLTSQQDYFDKRRNELNNKSPFSKLYTFDTNGQLVYQNNAFEQLSKMSGTDAYGKPNKTPKEQYDYIINTLGIDKKWLQYDSSGNKIKDDDYAAMVQAFWDKVDSDKDEMQNLHDSIEDQKNTILQKMDERNQLLQEMKDNQIEVENQVLEAVEAAAQREIDELQDVKDAFSDTIEDYIGGLQDALDKEQELYNNSQSEADLNTKRRQLDILRRSGGSAAEIASLEEEINTSERDLYFEYQQQEIDAIQDAADRQLEAMEQQINLMTEQLEYQKLHGLLWADVANIMKKSPADIASYIQTNNQQYWGKSALDLQESMRDVLFKAEQWDAFRKDTSDIKTLVSGLYSDQNNAAFDDFTKAMKQQFGNLWTDDSSAAVRDIFMKKLAETGDVTQAIAAVRKSDTYKTIQKAKEDKDNKSKTTTTGGNKKKNTNNNNNNDKGKLVKEYYNFNANGHWKMADYEKKTGVQIGQLEPHKFDGWIDTGAGGGKWQATCSVCGYTKISYSDPSGKVLQLDKNGKPISIYDKGGMVEKTGPAFLHAKEGVLTPEQTSILRNEILGNKNTSLMNLLLQFREITAGNASQNDYASIDRGYGSPITIEKAVVEMNVAKLANSYDARQAGKDALNEMVKIARKTGVQGVGR